MMNKQEIDITLTKVSSNSFGISFNTQNTHVKPPHCCENGGATELQVYIYPCAEKAMQKQFNLYQSEKQRIFLSKLI